MQLRHVNPSTSVVSVTYEVGQHRLFDVPDEVGAWLIDNQPGWSAYDGSLSDDPAELVDEIAALRARIVELEEQTGAKPKTRAKA